MSGKLFWQPVSSRSLPSTGTTERFGHTAVVIDSTDVWGTEFVVVFGGVSSGSGGEAQELSALGDVVVYQAEANSWFSPQINSKINPEPRAFHSSAVVGRFVYIFGGHVLTYERQANRKKRRFFNDLWRLDTDCWEWQCLVAADTAAAPPRRDMSALCAAPAEGKSNRSGSGGGTLNPPSPPPPPSSSASSLPGTPRKAPVAGTFDDMGQSGSEIQDPAQGCLVLFGGRLENGRVAGDTWIFSLESETWSQVRLASGASPAPRKLHSLTLASQAGSGGAPGTMGVFLYGGDRESSVLDDLWVLRSGGGGEPRWTQLRVSGAPAGRFGHACAALRHPARLAVVGGCQVQASLFSRTFVHCNETWILDLEQMGWIKGSGVDPAAPLPTERMCHSLCALGGGGGPMLLLGGRREGIVGDCWWLSVGDRPVWVRNPSSASSSVAADLDRREQVQVQDPDQDPGFRSGLRRVSISGQKQIDSASAAEASGNAQSFSRERSGGLLVGAGNGPSWSSNGNGKGNGDGTEVGLGNRNRVHTGADAGPERFNPSHSGTGDFVDVSGAFREEQQPEEASVARVGGGSQALEAEEEAFVALKARLLIPEASSSPGGEQPDSTGAGPGRYVYSEPNLLFGSRSESFYITRRYSEGVEDVPPLQSDVREGERDPGSKPPRAWAGVVEGSASASGRVVDSQKLASAVWSLQNDSEIQMQLIPALLDEVRRMVVAEIQNEWKRAGSAEGSSPGFTDGSGMNQRQDPRLHSGVAHWGGGVESLLVSVETHAGPAWLVNEAVRPEALRLSEVSELLRQYKRLTSVTAGAERASTR